MIINDSPASLLPKIGAVPFSMTPRPSISQDMAMLANIGARTVRVEVPWAETETSSNPAVYKVPDWIDGHIAAARAAKMTVVLLLDYSHPYYTGNVFTPPTTTPQLIAFTNYALHVASCYHGDDILYEIYNEPNNPGFWTGGPQPAQYAALLNAVVPSLRAAWPTAKITTAGVGEVTTGNGAVSFMSAVWPSVTLAVKGMIYAHALHPYSTGTPETLLTYVDAYRSGVGWQGKIIITEWGYPSVWVGSNENTRAIYAARMVCCAILAGVELMTFYNLRDTGSDQNNIENTFGLHSYTLVPKVAVASIRRITDAMAAAAVYNADKLASGVYRIKLFHDDGIVTTLLWATAVNAIAHQEPINYITDFQNSLGNSEPTRVFGGLANVSVANVYPVMILTGN
jgi:hypothetical protein